MSCYILFNVWDTQKLHRCPVMDLHKCPVLDLHKCSVFDLHKCPVSDLHKCPISDPESPELWEFRCGKPDLGSVRESGERRSGRCYHDLRENRHSCSLKTLTSLRLPPPQYPHTSWLYHLGPVLSHTVSPMPGQLAHFSSSGNRSKTRNRYRLPRAHTKTLDQVWLSSKWFL